MGGGARRLGRGARRLGGAASRWRTSTWLIAALVIVTIAAVAFAANRRTVGDPGVGDVVRVGVTEGASIPQYLSSSRLRLDRLAKTSTGQVYALVTLVDYVPPDRLAPILDGVSVAQVHARVPLPETQTQLVRIPAVRVPGDVIAGMDAEAARKDAESATDQRLARQYSGQTEHDRGMREIYESGARVSAAEAAAYRGHCACVYAVVVQGHPASLKTLAGRPGVRAVDPAPDLRRLDRAVFLPPLPEQDGLAGPPGVRPTS